MKIAIDSGHCTSGADTGARGCGKKEEVMTREIASQVARQLVALGHTVPICTINSAGSVRESLNGRCAKANNSGADLFVSIHINAGGGKGSEIYTYNARPLPEAQRVLSNLTSLGFTNRGIKDGSQLAVIRGTRMKSMLIEVCFIDTPSDIALYDKLGATQIANAIVSGILNRPMTKPEPPKPSTPPSKPSGTLYTVQVGAYRDKSNAEAKLKELKSKGIDGFVTSK